MFSEEVSHGWEFTPTKCFNGNITFGEPTCVNILVGEKVPGFSASHNDHHKALLGGLADEGDASRLVEGRGGQGLGACWASVRRWGMGREYRAVG